MLDSSTLFDCEDEISALLKLTVKCHYGVDKDLFTLYNELVKLSGCSQYAKIF